MASAVIGGRRYLAFGLVATVILFGAWSFATRNWWICSWNLSSYRPVGSFEFRVTVEDERFIADLKQFALSHHTKLFVDRFPPGAAGFRHRVNSMQIFGCDANIYIVNNWQPDVYVARISVGSNQQNGNKLAKAFYVSISHRHKIIKQSRQD
jgi:hypothetical protein